MDCNLISKRWFYCFLWSYESGRKRGVCWDFPMGIETINHISNSLTWVCFCSLYYGFRPKTHTHIWYLIYLHISYINHISNSLAWVRLAKLAGNLKILPSYGGGTKSWIWKTQVNSIVTPIYKNREKRFFEFGVRLDPPHWPSKFENHHVRVKFQNCHRPIEWPIKTCARRALSLWERF